MTQMSMFERAFGNWDFWQEIMLEMVRVELMFVLEMQGKQRILKELSLVGAEFVGKK